MTATLVEHAQFLNAAGTPISGGKQYFGTAGADPVATAGVTSIFSDRALTTSITNPQVLDANGRTTNKVWIAGKYSTQVNSLAGIVETLQFQDLDAGTSTASVSILAVSSIIGGDTITGITSAALSAYTDGQQFVFKTASVNTGAVTINFDGVGAKAVVKNVTQALQTGDFAANQEVIVIYNSTNDNFDWVNQRTGLDRDTSPQLAGTLDTNSHMIQWSNGATVASTAALVLGTDGNTFGVTGTTAITSIVAINGGTIVILRFSGILTLTHNATTLELPTGANIITAPGDIAIFQQKDASNWRCIAYQRANGFALINHVTAWVNFNGTGTPAIVDNFNVSSITDHAVGQYTVNTALNNANYSVGGTLTGDGTTALLNRYVMNVTGNGAGGALVKTASAVRIFTVLGATGVAVDLPGVFVQIMGT